MSIGKWFEQAGKDVGKFFSKEVPKFFNETIPSVGKPETYRPSLIGLRADKQKLEARLAESREKFFLGKVQLAAKTARYRALSEDYKRRFGEGAASTKIRVIKDEQWDAPATGAEKVLKDVDASVRTVFSSATLGIGEVFWAPAAAVRAKQEKEFLEKHNRGLHAVVKRVTAASKKIAAACDVLDKSIEELSVADASVAELAAERNESAYASVQSDEVASMASAMLSDGATVEQVELLTGLSAQQVSQLAAAEQGA